MHLGPTTFEGFQKLGVFFGGPYNEDYSILGSVLGYPNFGKLPFKPGLIRDRWGLVGLSGSYSAFLTWRCEGFGLGLQRPIETPNSELQPLKPKT